MQSPRVVTGSINKNMVCVDCGASISDKFIILGQEVLNSSFYELSEELLSSLALKSNDMVKNIWDNVKTSPTVIA